MIKKNKKESQSPFLQSFIEDSVIPVLKKTGFPFHSVSIKKEKDSGNYKISIFGDCDLDQLLKTLNAPIKATPLVSNFSIERDSSQNFGYFISYKKTRELSEEELDLVNECFLKVLPLLESTIKELTDQLKQTILNQKISEIRNPVELIPPKISKLFKNIKSFHSMKDWKAKVQLANSKGQDGEDFGEWGEIRYVMLSLDSGNIIPIAMSDEHHQGYDLIRDLINRGLIPKEKYIPINYMGNNYVEQKSNISTHLKAFTLWRQLGGPNSVVSGSREFSYDVTMDDFIKAKGKIKNSTEVKGELLPVGKRIIKNLETIHLGINAEREGQRFNQERLFESAFSIAKELSEMFYGSIGKLAETSLSAIAKAHAENDIKKIETIFFYHEGIKNSLHIKIKDIVSNKKDFDRNDFEKVFGDLEIALRELDRLFLTY